MILKNHGESHSITIAIPYKPWRLAAQMRVSGCSLDLEDTILAAAMAQPMG